MGFDSNYNYSIVDTGSSKDKDGKTQQVVKIRNPWLKEEDKEAWEAQRQKFEMEETDQSCNWFSWDQVK